jgi:hypothetical protein
MPMTWADCVRCPPMTDAPPDHTSEPASDPTPATHAPGAPAVMAARRQRLIVGGAVVLVAAVVAIVLVLMSGGSSSSPSGFKTTNPGQSAKVAGKNATALSQIGVWKTAVQSCGSKITCVEKADRTLGDQLHVYANYVGSLHQVGAAGKIINNTLNTSQVTANTFEILGDAQPTQANYNQVLHHFNLNGQVDKMTTAINNLAGVVSG